MANTEFHLETLAELAAVNQALHLILKHLAIASREPDKFLRAELEAGTKGIEAQQFWGIDPAHRDHVVASASARYADLITCVSKSLKG